MSATAAAQSLMLAFYGDDFTGSTDAMEALALSGLRTVLFLAPPAAELLNGKFAGLSCIGVAGSSRAQSPEEMDAQLLPVLRQLWALGAPVTHYKVCSTFDSAPEVGSIGHVADRVRRDITPGATLSVIAGAPPLRRYTVFGNHFAAAGDEVYRLDRHPTMSRHPVTPMHEADLRLHLAKQTPARIGLMSLPELAGDSATVDARLAAKLGEAPAMLLYDLADEASMRMVGRLLWQQSEVAPQFVIGSSGVEYALGTHWRVCGWAPSERARFPAVQPVKQLLVISGSASPMTATQIQWAADHDFVCLRAPADDLCRATTAGPARAKLFEAALTSLKGGRSVVVYSATGPDDPSIAATRAVLSASGAHVGTSARKLGSALGRLARDLLLHTGLRRLVVAGGDTSSYATQELGLYGLEMQAELTPGAPLCRGYSDDPRLDGLEIALKGGQMGKENYFGLARGG